MRDRRADRSKHDLLFFVRCSIMFEKMARLKMKEFDILVYSIIKRRRKFLLSLSENSRMARNLGRLSIDLIVVIINFLYTM